MQNSLVSQKDMGLIGASSFLSKLPNLLIGLIIFFSATQLGWHFWPNSALVYGIRIDYLSPTIYFLDVLIILFLVSTLRSDLLRKFRSLRDSRRVIGTSATQFENWRIWDLRLLSHLLPILLINLLFSQNPLATLSWSLHFILYYLFLATLFPKGPTCDWRSVLTTLGSDLLRQFQSLRDSRRVIGTSATQFENWRIWDLRFTVSSALTLSLLFQTTLATIQVYLGHSVGGLLYYLGERNIAVGSPGIALTTFMDHIILRAYGTFSHPNILAGYAVISLLIILRLCPGSDPLRKTRTSGLFSRLQNTIRRPGQTLWALILVTLLILLTQSRSAALSLFIFIIPIYFFKNIKSRIIYFVLFFSLLTSHISLISPPRSDLSFSQRLDLQGVSFSIITNYPIFGTGAQASISTYPALPLPKPRGGGGLQPDHNSFTLFLSWFGLFGVAALLSGSDLLRKSWPSAKMFSRSALGGETRSDPKGNLSILLPCTSSAVAREKCLQTLCSLGGLLPLLLFDHYLLTSPQGLFIFILYFFIIGSSDKLIHQTTD